MLIYFRNSGSLFFIIVILLSPSNSCSLQGKDSQNKGTILVLEVKPLLKTSEIITGGSIPTKGHAFTIGEQVSVELKIIENDISIDSVTIYIDGKVESILTSTPYQYIWETSNICPGRHSVAAVAVRNDGMYESSELTIDLLSDIVPVKYTYMIVREYHHDKDAFLQGLVYEDGYFYEGTGQKGSSYIRKIDANTGEVMQQQNLSQEYFGEGITILNDEIFQLTWQARKGFVYDKNSFQLIREFQYSSEGWGLTTDGNYLIMSDGSECLYFMDPDTFAEIKKIQVYTNTGPILKLNELEYINGEIYANVWKTDDMLRIDPETGKVLGIVDLSNIIDKNSLSEQAVLNGIAYDTQHNKLFVAGKYWSKLFEVELVSLE